MLIGLPTTGGTTTAVSAITSNATTTVNVTSASGAGIVAGTYIIVQTDTTDVHEVMAVTSVSTNALTVVRQSNGTNPSAANIATGKATQNEPVISKIVAPTKVDANAIPPAAKLTTRVLRQTKTIAIAISE